MTEKNTKKTTTKKTVKQTTAKKSVKKSPTTKQLAIKQVKYAALKKLPGEVVLTPEQQALEAHIIEKLDECRFVKDVAQAKDSLHEHYETIAKKYDLDLFYNLLADILNQDYGNTFAFLDVNPYSQDIWDRDTDYELFFNMEKFVDWFMENHVEFKKKMG